MCRLLLLLTVAVYVVNCSCPDGYTLQIDGKCISFAGRSDHSFDNLHTDAVNICKPVGATPVIIHNQDEEDYWTYTRAQTPTHIPLGIRCNTSTQRWEWDDGSSIDYQYFYSDDYMRENCVGANSNFYMDISGWWYRCDYCDSNNHNAFDIYCMKPLSPTPIPSPDAECGDFMYDDEDGDCYQVGMTNETFIDAQSICKSFGGNVVSIHNDQENSFVRRLAVSRNFVNGILIGAVVSGKSNNFSWIDGTAFDYSHFEPSFPLAGAGECVAMDTNGINGTWINIDCDLKLPYVCVRRSGDVEPSCSNTAYTEGEIIYTPGFPNTASVPCDYFLVVDSSKRVELEIYLLQANSCCDRLILYDGSIGGSVIANLTGEVKSGGTKYRTKTSNIMRVSWQPNGGVNVRGAMFTYRAV